jgi:hypothetical protein
MILQIQQRNDFLGRSDPGRQMIPGRAETDQQKQEVLKHLLHAWRQLPTLRLGQLVCAATGGRDIFYDEDEKLAADVGRYADGYPASPAD